MAPADVQLIANTLGAENPKNTSRLYDALARTKRRERGCTPVDYNPFMTSYASDSLPDYERSLQTLQSWIAEGNCHDEEFFERFPNRERGNCADIEFAAAVEADLELTLSVFRATSTLDADIPPNDAKAIFRLGRYLTLYSGVDGEFEAPRHGRPSGNVYPAFPPLQPCAGGKPR
jgi:hypothetical protein